MANQENYYFELDAEWEENSDIAVVMSRAQTHYGADFTEKCVNVLYFVLKPISLALRGQSQSEVLLAIAEARDKVDILFDLSLSMAQSHPSDGPSALQLAQPEESVDSKPVENIFEEDYD